MLRARVKVIEGWLTYHTVVTDVSTFFNTARGDEVEADMLWECRNVGIAGASVAEGVEKKPE